MTFEAYRACSTWAVKRAASVRLSGESCRRAAPVGGAQVALAGGGAGEGGLGDGGDRGGQVEGGLHGPAAGALLPGGVVDDVDERATGVRVGVGEDLGGDLDQIGAEAALVPGAEDVGDLGGAVPGDLAQQVVGLGDELHVGVFDAVVDHLDEVSGAVGADVGGAGFTVDLGADALEHRAEDGVRLRRAAGHDARPVEGALLAAGDARADEVQAAFAQRGLAAAGVGEVGVAAVDDHVAVLEERGELVDDGVGGSARLHHDHEAAGAGERGHELLGRLGRDEGALVAELVHQRAGAAGGAVVDGDGVTVPGEVTGQVAAHHSEAGDADGSGCVHEAACSSNVGHVRGGATP